MSLLTRLFSGRSARARMAPLYRAVVAEARRPHWYAQGGAPDTLDGRFDMVAAVLCLLLLRLEREGDGGREPAARLTECFIADMDGQLRQEGIGDVVVGKHIGRMMAALGGRLTAYRDGLAPGGDLADALVRNLWRGDPPADRGAHVAGGLRRLADEIAAVPLARLLIGALT